MNLPDIISSDEFGAPQLTNTVGSFCEVLDAAFVNGFNVRSCTMSIAAGVATVTVSAHGYSPDRTILIEGSAIAALNGRKKPTITGANSFTFPAPGLADGPVGGSMTCRRPGLGWAIAHSATGKRIYSRPNPMATTMLLYVDETLRTSSDNHAVVRGMYSASSISDMSALWSPDPHYTFLGPWSSAARGWSVVGTDMVMYLNIVDTTPAEIDDQSRTRSLSVFGDIIPHESADSSHCLLGFSTYKSYVSNGPSVANSTSIATTVGAGNSKLARGATQTGLQVEAVVISPYVLLGESGSAALPPMSDFTVDAIALTEFGSCVIRDGTTSVGGHIRGRLPGISLLLNNSFSLSTPLFTGDCATFATDDGSVALVRGPYTAMYAFSLHAEGWS